MQISGVFNLPVDSKWAQSQTRRATLDCLSNVGAITVNLPSIASLRAAGAGGVEVAVNDFDANAFANNITVVSNLAAADTIEGAANSVVAVNGETAIFVITGDNAWARL